MRGDVQGGFRFLMNNYFDMTRVPEQNMHAYRYWRARIHERVHDPRKAEILAPVIPPHHFGGKRLSLEQDFYDYFNRPNVDVIDIKSNPIISFTATGITQADGTHHDLDVIALATGFDSITGGIKDIDIVGLNGEKLADKWKMGTWTYLGLTTSNFPNFYFTYGPQGPTAFSNGPSCNELQGDWIVGLLEFMREKKMTRVDPKREDELRWKKGVEELALKGLRGHTDSWYNGANIPGKPREALNYAGGIPVYIKEIGREREGGFPGFHLK